MDYKALIRDVPDFPKPGIVFKDITTLLKDGRALKAAVLDMLRACPADVDAVAGIESRGFVFASLLAYELGVGVILVRKPGKLPAETVSASYELEYGENVLHMHTDAVRKGARILVVDDLLATGGTLKASCELVERLGGRVAGILVLVELSFLNGRKRLKNYDLTSIVRYEAE
jgi:adenine phosphoribosyltransferase